MRIMGNPLKHKQRLCCCNMVDYWKSTHSLIFCYDFGQFNQIPKFGITSNTWATNNYVFCATLKYAAQIGLNSWQWYTNGHKQNFCESTLSIYTIGSHMADHMFSNTITLITSSVSISFPIMSKESVHFLSHHVGRL